MSFKNTRRTNKSVSPLADKTITPECNSKCTQKAIIDTNGYTTCGDSHINGPSFKEFNESPAASSYYNRPRSSYRDEEIAYWTLSEINLELDNNSTYKFTQ